MKNTSLYALDFDGVLCDSAVETGITGWKVARQIWNDMEPPLPPVELIDQFRLARPIIETGYESALAMRLLFEGIDSQTILHDFADLKQDAIKQSKLTITRLKQLFGETRDTWIQQDLDEWINMNPLFNGIAKKLAELVENDLCYIVTTKQERFVSAILKANKIDMPGAKIFGLDRNLSKQVVLNDLLAQYPDRDIIFVEDRLPTLLGVLENDALQRVQLFLADWGYNTKSDRLEASKHPIELINLQEFINL